MTIEYQDHQILDDANDLLIHHVKRQTSIHKEDKHKIKLLLRQFLMDTFKHPRQVLSEDEREDEDDSSNKEDNESDNGTTGTTAGNITGTNGDVNNPAGNGAANTLTANNGTPSNNKDTSKATRSERARKKKEEKREKERAEEKTKKDRDEKTAKDEITEADIKVERKDGRRTPLHARDMEAVRILVIDLTLIFNCILDP